METYYKLTNDNDQTYGGCQWGPGVTNDADGLGELCTEHWIHVYADPYLAVMMNPIHGNYDLATAHMWKGPGMAGIDDGTKLGCTSYTTLWRIPMPEVTLTQKIAFGILAAKGVYNGSGFLAWADAWLSGEDRSSAAAVAMAVAMVAAKAVGAWPAAQSAGWAAWAAGTWETASETVWSARAAVAAEWAAEADKNLDLVALAHEAVEKY